ncbi:EthD domain-containing protein [Georgenia sp. EYE_87]|uniref:EthD domain-containing protein n=1 Tax=Georgenia sp. EYE_87 TaxID=2853448 RepID=UPI002002BAC8|nr:EthD domain-containing protein [Georgenia sp. EYE_87]MCK6212115.1 EthD domain-containing protein [Georgenia sp. EYE_87]
MTTIAYKLTILLKARDGLTPEEFTLAWLNLEEKRPLDAAGLVRHTFDRPLPGRPPASGAETAPFDAAVETWWQRKNDAADWVVSRQFEDRWLPDHLELLAGPPAAIGGIPELIWQRELPCDAAPVRILVLPVALRRLRFGDFVDHWTNRHAQLTLDGPQAKERLVSLEHTPAPIAPPARFARTRYDGVGAITFESPEALAAEFSSDHYQQVLAPDKPRFTDPTFSAALLTEPIVLLQLENEVS